MSSRPSSRLTIVEDTKGGKGVHVRGLTTVKVEDEAGALELLFQGEDLKTTAKHSESKRLKQSGGTEKRISNIRMSYFLRPQ